MENAHNPENKDIRFINSQYQDLFRIKDGSCIQVDYPDETVVRPCTFIDEYHTMVGNNVFHICEFAERMEHIGANYQAEPEIMGDEVAWQVGRDKFLALQASEDGYDYTLYDQSFAEIDGGQLDDPDLTMLQARSEILESFHLHQRDLRATPYETVLEKAEEAAERRPSVMKQLAQTEPKAPTKATHKHSDPER